MHFYKNYPQTIHTYLDRKIYKEHLFQDGSVGQVPRHVPRHSFRSIWHDPDHQKRQWQKPYDDGPTWRQVRSKENAIEGGAAGASAPSFIPKPVSFLPPSQPLPPKGAAGFNTGGIASLWQR